MTGIQDIPINIPADWSADWFREFIRDVLSDLDTRNSQGVGILVSGTSNEVATYEVDSENIDLAEGLETRALLGALSQKVEELEVLYNGVKIENVSLRKQIEDLKVEFC